MKRCARTRFGVAAGGVGLMGQLVVQQLEVRLGPAVQRRRRAPLIKDKQHHSTTYIKQNRPTTS